ncbi:MAG: DUF3365 domain-containing protein [Anaerosomatales bacterium]|nr:DUF3365 domain-containing protein [Anaerosomatales bacterium]
MAVVAFAVSAAIVVLGVRQAMRDYALEEAREKAEIIAARNLAVHDYFTHELKPSVFPLSRGTQGDDYFDPRWMSSSYAVRGMQDYFNERFEGEDFYLKDAAINARSPRNEADAIEAAFLAEMNEAGQLLTRSGVREIDGKPFFYVMRDGERMIEECLVCHGDPADAPADLVASYGAERSFGRKVGDFSSVVSIRVPLADAYASADRTAGVLSGWLIAAMLVTFAGVTVYNRRAVVAPIKSVRDQARAIASDTEVVGAEVSITGAREIEQLGEAFNEMSHRLKQLVDSLEDRVAERTEDLEMTNEELMNQVAEREAAEDLLVKQAEELERYHFQLEELVEQRTKQLEEANEELLAATRAKDLFMANMSHELRTPLNSVIGFGDVLLSGLAGPLTEEQQRQIQMIRDSGRHLLELVDEVLDLSRIETGGDRIDVDTFDAAATIAKAVRSLEPAAENKGITLSYKLPDSVMMRSDERKLRQIVLNIVGNAVKFTDVGAVTVVGRVLRDDFVIAVSDTGPGISDAHIDDIFQVFWQFSGADRGKPRGAGLGLAIALRMAEVLGGTISVRSELGSGSTFEVVLPLAAPTDGTHPQE